ncbi:hypothetical protein QWZ04_00610 [Vibrio tapetis subsp. quintayensis]|uniref:hypothetical protein n=1 Tax=Vibrio tapetis TaxID=52443 RepID=UPI0025B30D6B|nr:hypothetical protein [Vibrio tapetis]MDN3678838.1 hypothetical protein [Vibrio tapetis subsp. quintayensis]
MTKSERWAQITQIFANIATVIAIVFIVIQMNQNKELVDKQIQIEREREVFNRTIQISETIDNDMFNVTNSMSDSETTDLKRLNNIKKSVRSIVFLGVHLENNSIDKDIVYPLIARHGLDRYENYIYKYVESKHVSKWTSEENQLIISIMNEITYNAHYLKLVKVWSNEQRELLVKRQIAYGAIKIEAAKKN